MITDWQTNDFREATIAKSSSFFLRGCEFLWAGDKDPAVKNLGIVDLWHANGKVNLSSTKSDMHRLIISNDAFGGSMYRNIFLCLSVILLMLVSGHRAEAIVEHKELQLTIPVRFVSIQGDFLDRIGVDFDFPTVTDFFKTNSGFGGAVGGGVLFPDVIGNTDVSVAARVIASRFSADQIKTQNGTVFPTGGDVTDVGLGIDWALLIGRNDRMELLQAPRVTLPALKLTAGGGVLRRNVDLTINGMPFVDDSGTVPFVEFGAGLQFSLNGIGRPGQTALYVGVNHRITGGTDLRTLPFITSIPFRFHRTSTTSARVEIVMFVKPRIIIQDE